MSKTCIKCGEEKPLEAFSLHAKGKHGRNPRCRECKNLQAKEHYTANREDVLARQRLRRPAAERKTKYGVTQEQYEKMRAVQNGLCALGHPAERGLVVDHCHTTGAVRGLLCRQCNWALGLFRDDPARIQMAVEYLRIYNGELAESG